MKMLCHTEIGGVPVIVTENKDMLYVFEDVDEIEKAMRKIDLWLQT